MPQMAMLGKTLLQCTENSYAPLSSDLLPASGVSRARLHAADDHAGHDLARVVDHGVLGAVHVQRGHARHRAHHAQLLQPLHACAAILLGLGLGHHHRAAQIYAMPEEAVVPFYFRLDSVQLLLSSDVTSGRPTAKQTNSAYKLNQRAPSS